MITKISADSKLTLSEIEKIINSCAEYDTVVFEGVYRFNYTNKRLFMLGKETIQSAIMISKSNLFLDFSRAKIFFDVKDIINKFAFMNFYVTARNIKILGLDIQINYKGEASNSTVCGIYNTSLGFSADNCRIAIHSKKQVSAIGIYNYGGLNTHLNTKADNLSVVNSRIHINIDPSHTDLESNAIKSEAYGIYNYFANSMQDSDTYIDIKNKGKGENQSAVGIFNKGRFCRFSSDNIKANGRHSEGKSLNEAYAYGMIDEGMYSLVSNCNIIGEWGGKCVGMYLKGEYSNITANKILSTHTIKGITVNIEGKKIILSNNVLTSTSRNAKVIFSAGDGITISGNILEILQNPDYCESGVGMYLENGNNLIITDNQLLTIKNCCIFTKNAKITAKDNLFKNTGQYKIASDNKEIEKLLN